MKLQPNSPLTSFAPSWVSASTFLERRSTKNASASLRELEGHYFPARKIVLGLRLSHRVPLARTPRAGGVYDTPP